MSRKRSQRTKMKPARAKPGVTLVTNNVPAVPFSMERYKDGGHGHRVNWLPGMTEARMARYRKQTIAASRAAQLDIEALEDEERARFQARVTNLQAAEQRRKDTVSTLVDVQLRKEVSGK